jgi:hypothetical protein
MLRKRFLFSALIGLLSLGLAGTAFAVQENKIATEAGNYEFHFDTSSTDAGETALTHNYDAESLVDVGTEAGNWEYSFDGSNTSTDQIADGRDYSLEELTDLGSEEGNLEYNADKTGLQCVVC